MNVDTLGDTLVTVIKTENGFEGNNWLVGKPVGMVHNFLLLIYVTR